MLHDMEDYPQCICAVNDDDDFSSNEYQIISIIRQKLRVVLSSHDKKQHVGLKWFFEESSALGEASVKECCSVLGIHHHLIQIRLQYELYLHNMSAITPLTGHIPLALEDEILLTCGRDELILARIIWNNPGISQLVIQNKHVIVNLSERRFIVCNHDKLYLTGRNPILNQNINWSKCWSFYD